MKLIKIILGVVIVLSLVFFSTGFIVPKTEIDMEVTIDKPIAVVFSELSNIQKMKDWLPNIDSIQLLNEIPKKIGTTHTIFIKQGEQKTTMKRKIVSFIENQEIGYRYTSKDLLKTDTYLVSSLSDNQTKLMQKSSIAPNSFMLSCTYPWFKNRLQQLHVSYLNSFKELVEKNN